MATKEKEVATAHWQHWERLFTKEFGKETDRAAVILSVAMLDQVLETILRSYLCATNSSSDEMFDGPTAPLSTFSARINMCHRIGIISARFCRDLHIIRRIRNEFAHNISGCNFEVAGVRNRILELTRSSGVCENVPSVRKAAPAGPKGDFQVTVSMFLMDLWTTAEEIVQIPSLSDEDMYDKEVWLKIAEDQKAERKAKKEKQITEKAES